MQKYFSTILCLGVMLMHCNNNTTEPRPVELTLLTPIGGEILLVDAEFSITWNSKNAGAAIRIEISRDDGESWMTLVETENDGEYTWSVTEPEAEAVFIRIIDIESQKTATHENPLHIRTIGNLDVSFYLEYVADPYPSYQTVMWLEDENGEFLQSLFVSEWLARGGYNSRYVCSTWAGKANWSDGTTEEIDAVTSPTPEWGVESHYQFVLKERNVAPGTYKYSIETHIIGDYNILYTAEFDFLAEEDGAEPSPVFIPSQEPEAGLVLQHVKIKYGFSQE